MEAEVKKQAHRAERKEMEKAAEQPHELARMCLTIVSDLISFPHLSFHEYVTSVLRVTYRDRGAANLPSSWLQLPHQVRWLAGD